MPIPSFLMQNFIKMEGNYQSLIIQQHENLEWKIIEKNLEWTSKMSKHSVSSYSCLPNTTFKVACLTVFMDTPID